MYPSRSISGKSKYFVAHLLSGSAKRYHETLTKHLSDRFDITPLHERVPPHLTIKVPFEADEEQLTAVERTLRSFAHVNHAAPFTLTGFGHFGFRTIYLDVEGGDGATALARAALQTLRDNISWLPRPPLEGNKLHASVARFLSRRHYLRIWRMLKDQEPYFPAIMDNLAILKQEQKVWKVHTTIAFPNEPFSGDTQADLRESGRLLVS